MQRTGILRFFDYCFYRMAKAYLRHDGKDGVTASLAVGFMQGLSIASIIVIPIVLIYGVEFTKPYSKNIAYASMIINSIFMYKNFFYYKGKYDEFDALWANEDETDKFRHGFLVTLALASPMIVLGLAIWFTQH